MHKQRPPTISGQEQFEIKVTLIFREADGKRRLDNLLFEKIFLVEEEDDGSLHKPLVVADRVKEFHGLNHSIHFFVFSQYQVVAGEGHTENDGSHSFEAVNPLFTLRSLTTDIKHPKSKVKFNQMLHETFSNEQHT